MIPVQGVTDQTIAVLGLGLVGLDAELLDGLVQTSCGGVVERLVAASTDVVGHADLDVAAAAAASVVSAVAVAVAVVVTAGGEGEDHRAERGCELVTASQDASLGHS